MSDIIQLKTAKYKDVEFAFTEMPTKGGNRLIKLNYPGSDKQSIERQGKFPRSHSMTIVIPFENYFQERDRLLRILEDGVKGVLTHPTFGDVENIINGPYDLDETITELGAATITVTFFLDDAPGIPEQSSNLPSQAQSQSNILNSQLVEDIANDYEVGLNNTGNFSDSIDNLTNVFVAFSSAWADNQPSQERSAIFINLLKNFNRDKGNLVQDPSQLALDISNLFVAINDVYGDIEQLPNTGAITESSFTGPDIVPGSGVANNAGIVTITGGQNFIPSPEKALNSFISLSTFGDDDIEINPTTVSRIERKKNRELMRGFIRCTALSYSYLNAIQIDYQTTDDLELKQRELESLYQALRKDDILSNESLEQLDRLRVQAEKTFDDIIVRTSTVITINTPLVPLGTLVYSFYGNTDLLDTIAELNDVKQRAFVEGNIKVLTQ